MVDTGAGQHLMRKQDHTLFEETMTTKCQRLLLETANGLTYTDEKASSIIPTLGNIQIDDIYLMNKSCPRVLSTSKLIERGFRFSWDASGAWLKIPETKQTIWLPIINGVHFLVSPGVANYIKTYGIAAIPKAK